MSITNKERERVLNERVAPSYQRHSAGLESEVEILDRREAERDPNYDVAATLREIDERQAERCARARERREQRAAER